MSRLTFPLQQQVILAGLPHPTLEYAFAAPRRRWRFDLAWPGRKLACEIDGAVYVGGRHTRGTGVEKDCEKFAEALILGWRVLRVTPRHVRDGQALNWLERLIAAAE